MDYTVRRATSGDMPRIEEIYTYARSFMKKTGNPNQWGQHNPPVSVLQSNIAEQTLYVVEDLSGIHGVFYFQICQDPTYRLIFEGNWNYDCPYGVIHRIASDGSGGIFQTCMRFCKSFSDYLRIDTHQDNKIMQHVVEKAGFRRCGIIYIQDGTPRIAYDWHK